jgi:RNA polymerase sigma-70 factor (subfamily 1)
VTGEPSEAELVRRLQAGDEAAFDELLARHREAMLARAGRRLPPKLRRRVSVSDVVQEACIVAYERRKTFEHRGPDAFLHWLNAIVDRRAMQAVRTHVAAARRAIGREAPAPASSCEGPALAGGLPTPSQHAVGAEAALRARAALGALAPDYREVLRLARDERLPLRTVAERMGRTREAVKKLYARALARFTEEYRRREDEAP